MAVFETWATRHPACALVALFALSLTSRLVWLSRLPPGLIYPDEDAYLDMGSRIAAGHGHSQSFSLFDYIEKERPSAYWNFLFPLLVAGYRVAFSEHLALYRLAQVIISATLPMFVLVLGYRFFDNARVAWLAALACCFYPHLIYFSPLLVTEPVFLALLYLALALLFGVASEARWPVGAHLPVGIVLALSCLVRSLTLYMLPVLAAWSVVKHRRCAPAAAMVIAFALCSAPWVYRNTTVFGVPTLFDTKAGIQLYVFRDEGPRGVRRAFPIPPDLTGENEGRKNAELIRRGLRLDIEHPWTLVKNMYWKSTRFWWPLPNEPQNYRFLPLAVLTSGWVVPLGLFGLLACILPFRLRALWPLHALIVIVAAVSSVTQGGTRERLVIEPILILFASDRIVAMMRWGSRRAEAANAKEVGPDATATSPRSSQ